MSDSHPAPSSNKGTSASGGSAERQRFAQIAPVALAAVAEKAAALGVGGVGIVAWFEGDEPRNWVSDIRVVGRFWDPPEKDGPGANLLAIAFGKLTEMAVSLKPSGHAERPKAWGELGWEGGWIARGKTGHVLAAFSGAPSETDVVLSKLAVEILLRDL
jgi:hypothetical protein